VGVNTSPGIFTVPNIVDVNYTITALNDKTVILPEELQVQLKESATAGELDGDRTPGVPIGLTAKTKFWPASITIDANIPSTMANGNRLPIIDKTSPTQSRTELQAPRIRIH
jgi:hypothetical protein